MESKVTKDETVTMNLYNSQIQTTIRVL